MGLGAGVPHQLDHRLLAGLYWLRPEIEARRAEHLARALAGVLRGVLNG